MSDPQPDKLRPRPRRAEPLQPDKPVSGDEAMAPSSPPPPDDDKQDALRRGGYPPDKPT